MITAGDLPEGWTGDLWISTDDPRGKPGEVYTVLGVAHWDDEGPFAHEVQVHVSIGDWDNFWHFKPDHLCAYAIDGRLSDEDVKELEALADQWAIDNPIYRAYGDMLNPFKE